MLKFLLAKPDIDTHHNLVGRSSMSPRSASTLIVATLGGVLFLAGCQQQAEVPPAAPDAQTTEQTDDEDSKLMPQSESSAARIEQLQPLYVAQVQGLQRRLQAEYESLQAADTSEMQDSLLLNKSSDTGNDESKVDNKINSDDNDNNNNNDNNKTDSEPAADDISAMSSTNPKSSESVAAATNEADAETDINTSTEVGERDLTVLKRISLEPRKPVILSEEQITERYQLAMAELYQPVTTPLSAENVDTLINIATLVPQLFEHAEIAGRVSAKSPALARLIIQHQVWEQIEAQQVLDMQQMKLNQQKEFEMLMSKFNETIQDYDEQIAKYEQTLKAFQ